MPTFAFQARDSRGAQVEGTRDAPDQRTALTALREAGFFVTKLAPMSNAKAAKTPLANAPRVHAPTANAPTANAPVANAPTANASVAATPRKPSDLASLEASASPPKPNDAEAKAQAAGAPTPDIEYSKANVPSPATTPTASVPPISGSDLFAHANVKEMALFFRQMYSMLNSGTSISRALQVYAEHASNRSLKRAALQMSRETAEGRPLSQSMRAFPGLFSVLVVSMTDAGERGGRLDSICQRLAEYSERDFELNQSVKRETFYPKILLVCSILIPGVVTWFLHGFAAYLRLVIPPFIVIGMLFLAYRIFTRVLLITGREGPFRLALDAVKIQIPGLSKVVRSLATAKFARAMGSMYSSGVGAEHAMHISGESCGNAYVARRVMQCAPELTKGATFTETMLKTGQFPPIAIQMMATGEESGAIDTQLEKVADFLETEAEAAIRNSVKIFGVLVFLVMAFFIGRMAIEVIGGYGNAIGDLASETG